MLPKLQSFLCHFRDVLNTEQLLPLLYQEEALTFEEVQEIQEASSRDNRCMRLVNVFDRKGRAGIKKLISVVEKETSHLGHIQLAKQLKEGS